VRAAVRLGAAAGALLAIPAEQLRRDGAPPRAGAAPLSRQIQRGLTGEYPSLNLTLYPAAMPMPSNPSKHALRPELRKPVQCCAHTGACRRGAVCAVSRGLFTPVHALGAGPGLGRMAGRANCARCMRLRQRERLCLQTSLPAALRSGS